MKIIYNKIIPFKGYVAINLFGVLFVREELKHKVTGKVINHESIHTKQMKEMLYIFFYVWYIIEWIIRLLTCKHPYRNLSFEREAYYNEANNKYLNNRKLFSVLKYFNKKYRYGSK